MTAKKMKLDEWKKWLSQEPTRAKHYDKDLLLFLAERAKTIALAELEDGRYWIHLKMGKGVDDILWNEWDSFEGWSNVADVLWAELRKTLPPRDGKAGRKSMPASAS